MAETCAHMLKQSCSWKSGAKMDYTIQRQLKGALGMLTYLPKLWKSCKTVVIIARWNKANLRLNHWQSTRTYEAVEAHSCSDRVAMMSNTQLLINCRTFRSEGLCQLLTSGEMLVEVVTKWWCHKHMCRQSKHYDWFWYKNGSNTCGRVWLVKIWNKGS